jgi:rubrerythrin
MSDHYFPCGHKIVLGHTCPVCENAKLLAALRAVEWGRTSAEWDREHGDVCPSCGGRKEKGHAPNCQLAAALALAEGD